MGAGYFEAWEFFLLKPHFYKIFDFIRSICGGRSLCTDAESKVQRVQHAMDRLLRKVPAEKWSEGVWLPSIKHMSEEDRRQMCIELLLASADTSSVTLYYTLVLLAQRADLKQQLIEEIRAVEAVQSLDESLRSLPKMDALLKESMRLKPVGPMILRTAVADDEIPLEHGGRLQVKANTHFLLNIRDFHVDEAGLVSCLLLVAPSPFRTTLPSLWKSAWSATRTRSR